MIIILVANSVLLILNQVFVRNYFQKQIVEDVEVLSNEISRSMELQIGYNEKIVKELADNPILTNVVFSGDIRINFFMKKAEELDYKLFFFTDALGGAVNLTPGKERFDVSDRDFYIEGMKGNAFTTSVVRDELDGSKIFIISSPVYDMRGNLVGVFSGIKNLNFLSELCEKFQWNVSGGVQIVDGQGDLVGHRDRSLIESGLNLIEADGKNGNSGMAQFFQEMTSNRSGIGNYVYRDIKKVAGYSNIGNRDLKVMVSINENEVFLPISDLTKMLIFISFVLLLIIFGAVVFMAISISGAFRHLQSDVEHLANYNLNFESSRDYSRRRDEIGSIYTSLMQLRKNLIGIVGNISSHAQNTAATAQELSATAQSTSETAAQVAAAVSNIADGATLQAQDTENMNRQIGATSEIIREVIELLDDLFLAVGTIDQKKSEGQKALNDLEEVSGQSSQRAVAVNQVIIETDESAEQIAKASEMIQSISDQTNLLALNAAIEAARAGEQGRGFSVVAEEIRKLAEQSAGFSGEIKAIIESLKQRTAFAVSEMEAVGRIIQVQNMRLEETSSKFSEISGAVEKSKEIVDHVNTASKEMERKNEEMAKSIVALAGIAENNAATTQEAAASVETQVASIRDISDASEGLANLALQLQEEVAEFKM